MGIGWCGPRPAYLGHLACADPLSVLLLAVSLVIARGRQFGVLRRGLRLKSTNAFKTPGRRTHTQTQTWCPIAAEPGLVSSRYFCRFVVLPLLV